MNSGTFDHLLTLEDEWFDGDGKAFDRNVIETIERFYDKHLEGYIEPPLIFATPDGDILLEWTERDGKHPSVDLELEVMSASFHMWIETDDTSIERDFDIKTDDGWIDLKNFLMENL